MFELKKTWSYAEFKTCFTYQGLVLSLVLLLSTMAIRNKIPWFPESYKTHALVPSSSFQSNYPNSVVIVKLPESHFVPQSLLLYERAHRSVNLVLIGTKIKGTVYSNNQWMICLTWQMLGATQIRHAFHDARTYCSNTQGKVAFQTGILFFTHPVISNKCWKFSIPWQQVCSADNISQPWKSYFLYCSVQWVSVWFG